MNRDFCCVTLFSFLLIFFLDSYIFTDEFDHRVVTGNSGKYPFGVGIHKTAQCQIGGNHRGFLSEDPFIDT